MFPMRTRSLLVRRGCLVSIAVSCAVILFISACGSERGNPRYAAERKLFKARKLKEDVAKGGMKPEFLSKAVDGYRRIVADYGEAASQDPDIELLVLSAQMELAELEFRANLLTESRADFERAYDLAKNVPPARANALYSIGVIAEELGESAAALRSYERFSEEFLAADSLAGTVRMNPRYLVTPLKLAELAGRLDAPEKSARYLAEAERIYRHLLAHESDSALLKETQFNLLTTHLQQKRWNDGLALVSELRKRYDEPGDRSSLLYIEAKIHQDGMGDLPKALALYQSLVEKYPEAQEAPNAILAAAGIHRESGRLDEAMKLYDTVRGTYKDRVAAVVEAEWQIARILELKGDAEGASLQYRSIYTEFSETLQGFEAPLRIARNYQLKGQKDAAHAARNQALEHYEKLAAGQRAMGTKIMAEEYIIRTLSEDTRWREAAEKLLSLPGRYPEYTPFRENYLRAASIYERELKDKSGAIETLERCVEKYPGTELAQAAQKELARLTK